MVIRIQTSWTKSTLLLTVRQLPVVYMTVKQLAVSSTKTCENVIKIGYREIQLNNNSRLTGAAILSKVAAIHELWTISISAATEFPYYAS